MQPIKPQRQAEQIHAQVLAGRNYGARVIHMLDGPLAGEHHEVESGWPCPCEVQLPLEDETLARYIVDPSTGDARYAEDAA